MTEPVSWGVLGVAGIAVHKVIPAMQRSELSPVRAIASRSEGKADEAAASLGIDKAYASYEALLADPNIEAVYIPLPNHLHAEWTEKAASAGKHVLCEKPVAMNSDQARQMIAACRDAGVKFMEAFMYRLHPLWVEARRMVDSGVIGDLLAVQSFFSYRNVDPSNIRNIAEFGGGALMDVGCYCVNVSRTIAGTEPEAVQATATFGPTGVDLELAGLLRFRG